MNTDELRLFLVLMSERSVSRAAEELHLTQSAVSRQIRQLEEQIGTALFHRVRQRVVLTDAHMGTACRWRGYGLSVRVHQLAAVASPMSTPAIRRSMSST